MRFREFLLFEGQGLKAASPGEIYVDKDGTPFQFQEWDYKYPNDAPKFDSLKATVQAAQEVEAETSAEIRWFNQPSQSLKSFGLAKFKADNGKEIWLGRFFQSSNPNNTILDNMATTLGLSPDKKKSSAVKAESNLQPGQVGVADNKSRRIPAVIKVVASHEKGDMLVKSLQAASQGQPIVFEGGAPIVTALQDDFCEVVAPVAIISGHNVIKGPIDVAVRDIFKGEDISQAAVVFPPDQNNPLVDSFILLGKMQMGVSHKGKQGAKASITNIWKAKEEASQTSTGQAYIEKYAEAVAILDICKQQGQAIQPITLAERYNLINEQEAAKLKELMKNPMDKRLKLEGNPAAPNAVVRQPTNNDMAKVPRELERLFRMGGYKPGSYISFLCLARVAKIVADHINNSSEIDFGEAIRSFLNSSAMVQAKTMVAKTGDDAVVKQIAIVYPPEFKEKATMESNAYYGTGIKSKFSFSLPST
jgi:hypothetical protein